MTATLRLVGLLMLNSTSALILLCLLRFLCLALIKEGEVELVLGAWWGLLVHEHAVVRLLNQR